MPGLKSTLFLYCKYFNNFLSCRYEYDDHYFLTDPKEFIYEFFPLQPEWQLLSEPITLEDFEELPFVRSLFFRYQLAFPSQHMKSVMPTDQTGAIAKILSIRHLNIFRNVEIQGYKLLIGTRSESRFVGQSYGSE